MPIHFRFNKTATTTTTSIPTDSNRFVIKNSNQSRIIYLSFGCCCDGGVAIESKLFNDKFSH